MNQDHNPLPHREVIIVGTGFSALAVLTGDAG